MALLVGFEQSRLDHGLPSSDLSAIDFLTVGLGHERRGVQIIISVARSRGQFAHPLGKGRERGEVDLLYGFLEVECLAV